MGKHRGWPRGQVTARAQGSSETDQTGNGRTKDEGRVLTRGGAELPSIRTLAVSEPMGRGGRSTTMSLTESVSEKERRGCVGEPMNKTP